MDKVTKWWKELENPDHSVAYHACQELERMAQEEAVLMPYLDYCFAMLKENSSYARTRGLRLIVANASWDTTGEITKRLDEVLALLEDEKPTVIRACIQRLPLLVRADPTCGPSILTALDQLHMVVKPSMQSLIYKDKQKAIRQIKQWMMEETTKCEEDMK